jgi:ATP:cob(I)alamin adenosyltransferase
MSITTKTGDTGQTGLCSGERVWKDDLRVEAYGTVDELDAHLAEARQLAHDNKSRNVIKDIQKVLYRIMSELAVADNSFEDRISTKDVNKLGELIQEFEFKVDLKGFVITGNTPVSAKLDVCRTVARRAERRIVTLSRKETVSEVILQYMNRLSDFIFMLARWQEKKDNALEYVSKSD